MRQVEERLIILSETGCHAAEGEPAHLTLGQRGVWQDRRLVETVLAMLTLSCHFKKVMHRVWACCQARLHHGGLSRVGAVVWARAQRGWLRASFYGQI
jgi:hypothetical protein